MARSRSIACATGTNAATISRSLIIAAIEEPRIGHGLAREQVVEHQSQFRSQRADADMVGVDQFAAEFDHLPVGEMIAQAQHPAADAVLRLEHAHRDSGLAQAPRRGQPGDAGADDDDFIVRSGDRWHRARSRPASMR